MPKQITPKQDAFALAFFETGNATEAYRRAYDVGETAKDNWIHVEACQLLDNPKVALRLNELKEQAERLSIFNLQAAMGEYEEARQLALKEEHPSAAVSATAGKVKLYGLDRPRRFAIAGDPDGPPIKTEEIKAVDKLKDLLDAKSSGPTGPASQG